MSAMDNLSELRSFIDNVPQTSTNGTPTRGDTALNSAAGGARVGPPLDPVDELLAGQVALPKPAEPIQSDTWVGGRTSTGRSDVNLDARSAMMSNTLSELNAMIGNHSADTFSNEIPGVELDMPVQVEPQPSLKDQLSDVSINVQRPPVQGALRRRQPKNNKSEDDDFMDEATNEEVDSHDENKETEDTDESLEVVKKPQVVAIVAGILVVSFIVIIFFFKGLFSKNEDNTPTQTQAVAKGVPIPQPTTAVVSQRNLGRGTLLANTQMSFDTTVYTDTMIVNKFIELRGGVALFKFKGIPEHFNTEVEFVVTGDDYNRYANGVQITIKYKVISIDGIDYIFDAQLGQQT